MNKDLKCAFCGAQISQERIISAATRGGDVRTSESMGKAKYCSTEHRIEANWRIQAEKRSKERAAERAARIGKPKAARKKKTGPKGLTRKKGSRKRSKATV